MCVFLFLGLVVGKTGRKTGGGLLCISEHFKSSCFTIFIKWWGSTMISHINCIYKLEINKKTQNICYSFQRKKVFKNRNNLG